MKKKLKWLSILYDPVFLYLAIIAAGLLFLATSTVYFFEHEYNPMLRNYFDSLWWGVATITTIGYGDIVPTTLAGRIIGMALMLTGPVLFVLFTGVLLRSLLRIEVEKEIFSLERQLKNEQRETREIEEILLSINDRLARLEEIKSPINKKDK